MTHNENDPKMVKALAAIDLILQNLRSSDFVLRHGSACIDGLSEYRVDMAADIVEKAMS